MATPLPSIEDGASNVANGKMVKSTSPVPCYLLELPWEVRNKILRYLLHSGRPLWLLESVVVDDKNQGEGGEDEKGENHQNEEDLNEKCPEGYYKNYSFSPQVMRTCCQLYDEGQLILGSNTIGIYLCRRFENDWQWAVAGHCQKACTINGMSLGPKIKRMFHQAENFHIYIDLREFDIRPTFRDWGNQYMRFPVAQLCKRLVEKQNLKQCRIDVTLVDFERNEMSYHYQPEVVYLWQPDEKVCTFLASFQMLRCNEFSIDGCYEETAYELERSILVDEPVRNLWTMYESLKKFVKGISCLPDDLDHSQCDLDCDHHSGSGPLTLGLAYVLDFLGEVDECYRCEYYWYLLKEAVAWANVERFLELRSSLFEAIDNYQAKKKRELLLLDVACGGLVEEEVSEEEVCEEEGCEEEGSEEEGSEE